MKTSRRSLPFLLLWTLIHPVADAQQAEKLLKPVVDAEWMIERGHAVEALPILTPLVQPDSSLTDAERGVALNTLGTVYRSLDRLEEARRSYERSIRILSGLPDQKVELASTLNNLGGVEELAGNPDASKKLRRRAMRLDRQTGNHAGMALAFNNLANLSLTQGDLSEARRYDRQALEEARQTTGIDAGNLAAIYSVKGAIARSGDDPKEAVAAYDQAIAFQMRFCPDGCPKLGLLYALRAESNGMLKAYPQSTADYQTSLSMLASESQDYLQVELSYSAMLRSAGSLADVQRLEVQARTGLESMHSRPCGGCTISAESLR